MRWFWCLPVALQMSAIVTAQSGTRPGLTSVPSTSNYQLDIRILMGSSPRERIRAQEWSRLFQRLGRAATIMTDAGRARPGVRVVEGNRVSWIRLTGLLDRSGVVVFGGRRFKLTDESELENYLEDLVASGPEGPVRLRPAWGLSEEQFEDVLRQLAEPARRDITTSSAAAAVESLNLPEDFHVAWTEEGRRLGLTDRKTEAWMDPARLSTGAALAIALAQFGLGFRPMQHPRDGYVIEIDVGNESSNFWPVGWKNSQPLTQVAPILFRSIPVDLEEVELDALIAVIAEKVELPHYYSQYALREKGIDLAGLVYSRKPDRISPFRLMQLIGRKYGMELPVRTDEAGDLFLWCTTAENQAAWKKRFAHVIPGRPFR